MNLSVHRHLDLICLVITLITVLITVLFIMGERWGLTKVTTDATANRDRLFSTRDYDDSWSPDTATSIDLDHLEQLTTSGAYLLDGNLYLARGGTYVLQGALADRQIIVDANNDKVQLVLDGVQLTHQTLAPLIVKSADKVFLTLPEHADNNIIATNLTTAEASASGADAAIYAKSDLTLNGTGRLRVQASGGHGIKSTDDLVVTGGKIVVDATNAAILGKDAVRIAAGDFSLTGHDGIKANRLDRPDQGYVVIAGGQFQLTVTGDGIQAETDLQITAGDFEIITGGGSDQAPVRQEEFGPGGPPTFGQLGDQAPEMTIKTSPTRASTATATTDNTSRKCLKSGRTLSISGGNFQLDCYDDAIHSNGDLAIAGGKLMISSGDDALHADQTVTLASADLVVETSYEAVEGKNISVLSGNYDLTSHDDGFNASDGTGNDFFGLTPLDFSPVSNPRQATSTDNFMPGAPPELPPNTTSAQPNADLSVLQIDGGTIRVHAGGDGLDSNGHVFVNGGDIIVDGPSSNFNGALDSGSESGGELTITGGSILALGSAGMAEGFSTNSTQPSFLVVFDHDFAAGDTLAISDAQGKTLTDYVITKAGSSLVYSSPQLQLGESYIIAVGEQTQTITQDSLVVKIGDNGGWGGGRGGFGGRPRDFDPDVRPAVNSNQF